MYSIEYNKLDNMDRILKALTDWADENVYNRGKRKKPTAKQRKKAAAKRRMQKKSRR